MTVIASVIYVSTGVIILENVSTVFNIPTSSYLPKTNFPSVFLRIKYGLDKSKKKKVHYII